MAITIVKNLPNLVPVKNDAWITVQSSSSNTYFLVDVYYNDPTPFVKLATLKMPTDANNRVTFNIKTIIQSLGALPDLIDVHLPAFNQAAISACTKNIKGCAVYVSERDKTTNAEIELAVLQCRGLLAGVVFEKFAFNYLLNYIGSGATIRKFLTTQAEQNTSKLQQQYLYYYHADGFYSGSVQVRSMAYFTDGSAPVETTQFTITPSIGDLLLIPAGYNQFNLDAIAAAAGNKTIYKYEVYLFRVGAPSTRFSEIRTYNIRQVCNADDRFFIFSNSMGGVDSMYAVSTDEIEVKTAVDTAEQFVGDDYSVTNGQFFDYDKTGNRDFKVKTELLTRAARLQLREFFTSPKVWEVKDGQFLPIKVTTTSVVLDKGVSAYQSISFEYKYQFNDVV